MKILLPVQLNPISRRKDKSIKMSFETRELSPEETMTMMAMEGQEMWMALAPNEDEIPDIPQEDAEVEGKSQSQRLKGVIYILYRQAVDKQKYVGTFEGYYREYMESIIIKQKEKIEE